LLKAHVIVSIGMKIGSYASKHAAQLVCIRLL